MLDNRIYTFLKLCKLMNYRKTAESLNMTQPAVTQHIHFLEREYNCKLFTYDKHNLNITSKGILLKKYAQSFVYNDTRLRNQINKTDIKNIRLGVTKSIGNYVIGDKISYLIDNNNLSLSLYVDNTKTLLKMLDDSKLDLILIEGFFDKKEYDFKLFKKERFVGICSKKHPFYNQSLSINNIFSENFICREEGSGTRAIFEKFLYENNYTINSFKKIISISSFELIKKLILDNKGISFVYESVANSNTNIGTFTFKDTSIVREFNWVFLKNTFAQEDLSIF